MKGLFRLALRLFPRAFLIRFSYLVAPLTAFFLRGSKYTDPIDDKSYRCFLPYGYKKMRPNVLGPGTLSLERHRLLWLYLKTETDFFSKKRKVLHFAPEQAFYKRFKKMPLIDYTTTDLNSPLAQIKADITNLPFENDSFDLIFCNHVLEHIPNDRRAMSELYRILKPGGVGIFQVPLDNSRSNTYEDFTIKTPKERAIAFGQYDHVRVYGLDYFERLEETGFDVKKIDYSKKLGAKLTNKYRLALGEILPLCIKPLFRK